MIREKSCGAVIYTESNGIRRYLIEQMKGGHYSMCKGHVEGEETEAETARREIREETGLQLEVNTDFRAVIAYSPYHGCIKDVVYFLARSETLETVPQPQEVRGISWLEYAPAMEILSFPDDREVLQRAEKFLKNTVDKQKNL